jgi:murein DD-endopeptidase MepM/ murein hydrolase activator NlpD
MRIYILLVLVLLLGTEPNPPSFPTIPIAPISQTFGNLGHVGIDFKVPVGSEVYADLDGFIIQELETEGTYGRFIEIKHADGNVSLYGHLSEFKVKKYDWVTSGQLIALSGGDIRDRYAGSSSGAHLHWEVRPKGHTDTNKYNINPMEYLMSFTDIDYKMATVNSNIGLNVRSTPGKNSVLIYSLYCKEIVQVVEEKNGWARLNSLRPEWVLAKWLDKEKIK